MTQLLVFNASLRFVFQRLAFGLVVLSALGLVGYTAACVVGFAPWLQLSLTFGETVYTGAGPVVQAGFTALAVSLAFFLPTNARVMALENSHRSFTIGMRDVARAYSVAHARDREELFDLSSEFDSIRARMAFLRDHPDLSELEPSALEVAAQMSHVSSELAQVYSDAAVHRAKDFLVQRQIEVEEFNKRLHKAKAAATEIHQWAERMRMDEAVAEAQLARLSAELDEVLPELGLSIKEMAERGRFVEPDHAETAPEITPLPDDLGFADDGERIVALQSKRAAE